MNGFWYRLFSYGCVLCATESYMHGSFWRAFILLVAAAL